MWRRLAVAVAGAALGAGLPALAAAPPFYADKANLLAYADAHGTLQPVRTAADWQKRREHILASMQAVMGPLPPDSSKVPPEVTTLSEEHLPGVVRRRISFAAEKDDRVPAYLLVPQDLKAKAPAMLCLHQTTAIGKAEPAGLGGSPNLHYGLELARRGYVALCPDYPSFGDYKVDPYKRGYASATMKAVWNHMRAIDVLASMPEVDGRRIGCIGHSLGGHNAAFLAAFDTRVAAVVSSCGLNSFAKYSGGNLAGWSHPGYMPRIAGVYGCDPKRMPFDFTEVVAAVAPRPFFISAPLGDTNFEVSGVKDCVVAARPVYSLLGAAGKLVAVHPEGGHDFPPDARRAAYEFLDGVLRPGSPAGRPAMSLQRRRATGGTQASPDFRSFGRYAMTPSRV